MRDQEIRKGTAGRFRALLPVVLLFVFSGAAYGNALFGGFVYDDMTVILKNPWITDIKYLPDIFSKSVWGFYQAAPVSNYYRPLMHVFFMITYYGFGLATWAFHLLNILIHAGISILVFLLGTVLLRRFGAPAATPSSVGEKLASPPFIGALLFAVHPIHTEAVAWVTALTEISFALFYLLSLYLYVSQSDDGPGVNVRLLLSAVAFFFAALCKETALTLPVLLLVYEYALRRRSPLDRDVLVRAFPFAVAAACYFSLRIYALGDFLPLQSHQAMSGYSQVINVLPLFAQYLNKLFVPINLTLFHPFEPITSLASAQGAVSLLVVAAFLAAVAVAFRKNRIVFFGLMLVLVPLLPAFYIGGIEVRPFAERYLYVPSAGLALMCVVMVQWMRRRRIGRSAAVATGALFLLAGIYAALTIDRNGVWKDNYTLFSDCVAKSPHDVEAMYNLGIAAQRRGKLEEAVGYLQNVLAQDLTYAPAYYALGSVYVKQGRDRKALRKFQTLLVLRPRHAKAHYRMGNILFRTGRIDEAIAHYVDAVTHDPRFFDAYLKLGSAYLQAGNIDDAIEAFGEAVRLKPSSMIARGMLDAAYRSSHE